MAVRRFGTASDYHWKPATKLYNAWHTGVPVILGCDSAYQAERKSKLDYIEVTSIDEAIAALKRLRDDRELRRAMVENGQVRAKETTPSRLVSRWQSFITEVAIPAHHRWCNAPNFTRQVFLTRRYIALSTREKRKDIQQLRNSLGIRSRLRPIMSRIRGM